MNKFIVALGAMLVVASPAFASETVPGNIKVRTINDATVSNYVHTVADTGSNEAYGGAGTLVVSGGNVSEAEGANKTGNGGNTVKGGGGGVVQTGDASATSNVTNKINVSKAKIAATAWAANHIRVATENAVDLKNKVKTEAFTGNNVADGSVAAAEIDGADLESAGGSNTLGNGGNTIDGGADGGGAVVTGKATSLSNLLNVLNRTLSRIQK